MRYEFACARAQSSWLDVDPLPLTAWSADPRAGRADRAVLDWTIGQVGHDDLAVIHPSSRYCAPEEVDDLTGGRTGAEDGSDTARLELVRVVLGDGPSYKNEHVVGALLT